MYKCDNCTKEYKSKKRFLNHVTNCSESIKELSDLEAEEDDISLFSGLKSNYTNSIAPSITSSISSKTMYNKLAKYKKYKKELEKSKEENTRMHEYYKSQIDSLFEEKNEILEMYNEQKRTMYEEKEKYRKEFSDKLSLEKKKLDNKYNSKNMSESSKLYATIENLQTQINILTEEKENLQNNFELQLKERQNTHKINNDENNEKLRALTRIIDNFKSENERLTQTVTNNQEYYNKQKDQEINQLKLLHVNALRNKDEIIESNTRESDKEKNRLKTEIENLKKSFDTNRETYDKRLQGVKEELHERFALTISNLEKKIETNNQNHTQEQEKLKMDYENKLREQELLEHKLKNGFKNKMHDQQLEFDRDIARYKKEVEQLKNDCALSLDKQKYEFNEKITEMKKEHDILVNFNLEKYEKEHKDHVSELNATILELEKTNHSIGNQLSIFRSSVGTLKDECTRLKTQYVNKLNNQKEDYTSLISKKDSKISELENEIKEFNVTRQKLTDSHNSEVNVLKSENNRLQSKLEIIHHENINITKKCNELKQIEYNNEKLLNNLSNFKEQYNDIKSENTELKQAKDDISRKYESMKTEYVDKIENLRLQSVSLSEENIKLTGQIEKYKQDLQNTEGLLNNSSEDSKQKLVQYNSLLGQFKSQIESLKADNQNYIEQNNELTSKISEAENNMKKIEYTTMISLEKQKKEFTEQFTSVITEKDNTIQEYFEQIEALNKEIQKLNIIVKAKEESFKLQVDKISQLSNPEKEKLKKIEEENTTKDEKINKLKEYCSDIHKMSEKYKALLELKSSDMISLEKKYAILEEKSKTPVKDTKELNNMKKLRDNCLQQIKNIQKELNQVKLERDKSTTELERLRGEVTNNLEKAEKTIEKLKQEKEEEISKQEFLMNKKDERIQYLEKILLNNRNELEVVIRSSYQTELNKRDETIDSLKKELLKKIRKEEDFNNILAKKEININYYKKKLAEYN